MADLEISLTSADYASLGPLAMGDVRPEGVALNLIRGPRGDMLRRALEDQSVSGGESSLGLHLLRIDRGDRSFVAIPAFVQRAFMGRHIYVRRSDATNLFLRRDGLRIGMYSWVATGSIWFRHLLRHIGAPAGSFHWRVGPTAANDPFKAGDTPAFVEVAPRGRGLADMLADGEIDVMLSPSRPAGLGAPDAPIVRLYPDVRAADRDYFTKTGVFPPQHLIILRRAVWEAAPWAARSLQTAFETAETRFLANQRANPFATPWMEIELDETAGLMGDHFHPHGVEGNRAALDVFAEQAHLSGLSSRCVAVDELFEEFLRS